MSGTQSAPAAPAYTMGTDAAAYPAYSVPAQTQQQAQAANQASAAQIQQAQALQNDPLYQNNTANGAAPAGFTDGGVMGPSGFGYNATDPAFQP